MKLLFLSILCITTTLYAHKLNLFLREEGKNLAIQSYFTQSSPCKMCEVVLYDKEQKELLKTLTNAEGKAIVAMPLSSFLVVVTATMGHQQQVFYEVQPQIEEKVNTAPPPPSSDNSLQKIALGLLIIVGFFGILQLTKKRS